MLLFCFLFVGVRSQLIFSFISHLFYNLQYYNCLFVCLNAMNIRAIRSKRVRKLFTDWKSTTNWIAAKKNCMIFHANEKNRELKEKSVESVWDETDSARQRRTASEHSKEKVNGNEHTTDPYNRTWNKNMN